MNGIKSILIVVNRITGSTERRKRALRYANDWTEDIVKFYKSHNQYENIDVEKFITASGDVKFDISVLAHCGRSLIKHAGNLKNQQASSFIHEMVNNVENIRRYLHSPAAQKERIRQGLINLRVSCAELQKILVIIKQQ
jgi:hypothetical protein